MMIRLAILPFALFAAGMAQAEEKKNLFDRVSHGYADHDGVKIHYASLGEGDPIIMIHGFPDFWYTWRDQMEVLSANYQVVAIDQRGYNKSDKPKGVDNYSLDHLAGDIDAVVNVLQSDWLSRIERV